MYKQEVSPYLQKWDNPIISNRDLVTFYKNGTTQCISNRKLDTISQKWNNPIYIKQGAGPFFTKIG
jgi:hypothetical protein